MYAHRTNDARAMIARDVEVKTDTITGGWHGRESE